MAATIARATGYDKSRAKETHRLGSEMAVVQAATWETFAGATVNRDGSGYVEVRRGRETFRYEFGPESGPLATEPTRRERAAALLMDTDIDGILSAES